MKEHHLLVFIPDRLQDLADEAKLQVVADDNKDRVELFVASFNGHHLGLDTPRVGKFLVARKLPEAHGQVQEKET